MVYVYNSSVRIKEVKIMVTMLTVSPGNNVMVKRMIAEPFVNSLYLENTFEEHDEESLVVELTTQLKLLVQLRVCFDCLKI